MRLLIANWKSHKSYADACEWVRILTSFDLSTLSPDLTIILAPSFTHLSGLHAIAKDTNIRLCAQDISEYAPGAHTGQTSGENLSGLVEYTLIGHSETQEKYLLSSQEINDKVQQATLFSIKPIQCIRDAHELEQNVAIVAFEPTSSIGNDNPDSKEHVMRIKDNLRLPYEYFLYGGSVTQDNALNYLRNNLVDGFLVGTDSLDPLSFFNIARLF